MRKHDPFCHIVSLVAQLSPRVGRLSPELCWQLTARLPLDLPQTRLDGGRLSGLDDHSRRLAQYRVDPLKRRDDVGEEPAEIVIVLIERQPGDRVPELLDPNADQGRLAETGRR